MFDFFPILERRGNRFVVFAEYEECCGWIEERIGGCCYCGENTGTDWYSCCLNSLSSQDIKNLLNQLKTDFVVTEELIRVRSLLHHSPTSEFEPDHLVQETKIGISVNKLRSCADKDVAELAKEIIKKWKNDVKNDPAAKNETKKNLPALEARSPDSTSSLSLGLLCRA